MHRQIESGLHTELVEQIVLHSGDIISGKFNSIRLDNREFKLNGKLYDIVSSNVVGDSIIFQCINDTKEEELELKFVKLVVNNLDSGEAPIPIRNTIQILHLDAIMTQCDYLKRIAEKNIIYSHLIAKVLQPTLKIPFPPPKNPPTLS